jgi:hypothetical protein
MAIVLGQGYSAGYLLTRSASSVTVTKLKVNAATSSSCLSLFVPLQAQ